MTAARTVELPEQQIDFLDRLAKATDQSRDGVVSSVVARMMDNYNHVLSKIEQGEADVRAGRVHSMEEVEESSRRIIEKYIKASS
jgi:predicted transcriptional regulator